jgi:hypothetical protein
LSMQSHRGISTSINFFHICEISQEKEIFLVDSLSISEA